MKEKPNKKTVLLFSGGMDSYLAYRLYHPDVLLYCAARHRYMDREHRAVLELGLGLQVVVDRTLDLSTWERPEDAQVPLRNLLFAAVGSRYGDTVWLASLRGEQSWDKTAEFEEKASDVFSYCYSSSYWCEGREVVVQSPVFGFTKASLLATAVAVAGVTREEVGRTVSCYAPGGFCGACSSCFKRACATVLNGWLEEYQQDPFDSACGWGYQQKARAGKYPDYRAAEIERAFALRRPL